MATQTPAWFETKYKSTVIHRLQTEGYLLKGCYEGGTEIKGSIVTWKRAGTGEATEMSGAIEIRPTLNAGRDTVTATMRDWEANEYIRNRDLDKMSQKEQDVAFQTCTMAIGRRFDRIIIDALDAAAGAITTIGNGGAGISLLDTVTAQSDIMDTGLSGAAEIYCFLPSRLFQQLLLFREFASSDYQGDDYILRKKWGARTFQGVTYMSGPSAYFANPSANQREGYMWVKQAVGFESNYALNSRIDYVPELKAHLVANDIGACSAVLLPEGIRRLRFDNGAALARNT